MERKIGEIKQVNGEWYQCLKSASCDECAFLNSNCIDTPNIKCSADDRKDHCSVIFKKLKKIGEPFTIGRELCQHYKVFDIDNVCGDVSWNVHNYKAKTILIELKQNEEDMKTIKINKEDLDFLIDKIRYKILPKHVDYNKITNEISKLFSVDDTKHSNSENIGKNLKPFDLQAAKSGKPVCTRDGRKARIICFDRVTNSTNEYTGHLIVLVTNPNGDEQSFYYTEKGNLAGRDEYDNHKWDLMMLPEKKEGWVNVYRDEESKRVYCGEFIFSEREKAEKHYECNDTKVATASIGWEE